MECTDRNTARNLLADIGCGDGIKTTVAGCMSIKAEFARPVKERMKIPVPTGKGTRNKANPNKEQEGGWTVIGGKQRNQTHVDNSGTSPNRQEPPQHNTQGMAEGSPMETGLSKAPRQQISTQRQLFSSVVEGSPTPMTGIQQQVSQSLKQMNEEQNRMINTRLASMERTLTLRSTHKSTADTQMEQRMQLCEQNMVKTDQCVEALKQALKQNTEDIATNHGLLREITQIKGKITEMEKELATMPPPNFTAPDLQGMDPEQSVQALLRLMAVQQQQATTRQAVQAQEKELLLILREKQDEALAHTTHRTEVQQNQILATLAAFEQHMGGNPQQGLTIREATPPGLDTALVTPTSDSGTGPGSGDKRTAAHRSPGKNTAAHREVRQDTGNHIREEEMTEQMQE